MNGGTSFVKCGQEEVNSDAETWADKEFPTSAPDVAVTDDEYFEKLDRDLANEADELHAISLVALRKNEAKHPLLCLQARPARQS